MHPDRVLVWERDSCCSSKNKLTDQKIALLTWSKPGEFSGNGPWSMRPFDRAARPRSYIYEIPLLDLPFVVATDCSVELRSLATGRTRRTKWLNESSDLQPLSKCNVPDTACRITIKPCVVPETAQWRVYLVGEKPNGIIVVAFI